MVGEVAGVSEEAAVEVVVRVNDESSKEYRGDEC